MPFYTFLTTVFFLGLWVSAKTPETRLFAEMDKLLAPLATESGWKSFLNAHPKLCGNVDKNSATYVGLEPLKMEIDGHEENGGLSCRAVYIAAPPARVVQIIDDPKYFQSLYGLDKSAETGPRLNDGTYEARVFKIIPGVETQDYILKYSSHWEDQVWIERARQVSDTHDFALRDNAKMVEPLESGSLHREVTVVFPNRWWMKMKFISGFIQKITQRELMKINVALKCATEKTETLSNDAAKSCHKVAEHDI